jgi:hypothetical protein
MCSRRSGLLAEEYTHLALLCASIISMISIHLIQLHNHISLCRSLPGRSESNMHI